MSIFIILIAIFLEHKKLLNNLRNWFNDKLIAYAKLFTRNPVSNQREIRLVYLFACLPAVLILFIVWALFYRFHIIGFIINFIIFILTVEILTWKENSKNSEEAYQLFIVTYATRFFATLFWFMVLPSGIGAICYLIILAISAEFKKQALDLVVYNVTVDKMLFYASVIPYLILCLFIAVAGDFEEVMHFVIAQRKGFNKSFYYLENMLNEAILIAIGKTKFQQSIKYENIDNTESGLVSGANISPQIRQYIVAILYRAGLFFIGILFIIIFASMVS